MTSVRKNIIANLVGNGLTAVLALVLVPLYIKFLSIEAWGVVGIFISLQSFCVLLDFGLAATLTRELARLSVQKDKSQEMRDLVRTLELIYWAVALLIGVSLFMLAPLIANHWLHASQLSAGTIQNAIRLMAVAVSLQWPFGLYSGGLSGLQRQVLLSGINSSLAVLRGAGTVLILWKISATLQAVFVWQVAISFLQTGVAGVFLWRSLPSTAAASTFQRKLLRTTWRFSAGIGGTAILGVILTQMDKVILSRMLSLEMFGYYVLAGSVMGGIYLFAGPIFQAFYPKFTQLVSLGDEEGLKELYHHSCQFMSVIILPVATVIAFYSREVLFLWTGNSATAEHTHLILSILIVGTALNASLYLPIALQYAYGWTRLIFSLNSISVLLLCPAIIMLASRYGSVGAASVWVIFNCGHILIGIQLMHRRILRGQQWKWYFEDVGLPLVVSVGIATLCLLVVPTGGTRSQLLAFLAGATLFVTGSTSLATPVTRAGFVSYIRSRRRRALNILQ